MVAHCNNTLRRSTEIFAKKGQRYMCRARFWLLYYLVLCYCVTLYGVSKECTEEQFQSEDCPPGQGPGRGGPQVKVQERGAPRSRSGKGGPPRSRSRRGAPPRSRSRKGGPHFQVWVKVRRGAPTQDKVVQKKDKFLDKKMDKKLDTILETQSWSILNGFA